MSSPYPWLHYEKALPILAVIDVPKALSLAQRYEVATKDLPKEASPTGLFSALDAKFLADFMDLLRSLDPKNVRRLAMIALAKFEDLEAMDLNPALEQAALSEIGRLSPAEVIAAVLFFMGMRGPASSPAQSSSAEEAAAGVENLTGTSASSDAP